MDHDADTSSSFGGLQRTKRFVHVHNSPDREHPLVSASIPDFYVVSVASLPVLPFMLDPAATAIDALFSWSRERDLAAMTGRNSGIMVALNNDALARPQRVPAN
jgi:hypothetical protein